MKRYRTTYLLAVIAVALFASASSASAATVSIEAGPLTAAADSDPLVREALQRSQQVTRDAHVRSRRTIDQALAHRVLRRGLLRAERIRARARNRADRLRANAAAQEQAIDRARSSSDGVFALVSATGQVIEQRGGVFVWHPGTGIYVLTFASKPGCGNVGASLPFQSTLGNVGLRADSGDAIEVVNRNAKGTLTNGAFYLALSC